MTTFSRLRAERLFTALSSVSLRCSQLGAFTAIDYHLASRDLSQRNASIFERQARVRNRQEGSYLFAFVRALRSFWPATESAALQQVEHVLHSFGLIRQLSTFPLKGDSPRIPAWRPSHQPSNRFLCHAGCIAEKLKSTSERLGGQQLSQFAASCCAIGEQPLGRPMSSRRDDKRKHASAKVAEGLCRSWRGTLVTVVEAVGSGVNA